MTGAPLGERHRRALLLIKETPGISAKAIRATTGWPRRSLWAVLDLLKDEKLVEERLSLKDTRVRLYFPSRSPA